MGQTPKRTLQLKEQICLGVELLRRNRICSMFGLKFSLLKLWKEKNTQPALRILTRSAYFLVVNERTGYIIIQLNTMRRTKLKITEIVC